MSTQIIKVTHVSKCRRQGLPWGRCRAYLSGRAQTQENEKIAVSSGLLTEGDFIKNISEHAVIEHKLLKV